MPLRDHFRSPLDGKRSWTGLHGGWPMVIVQQLVQKLPEPYFAEPNVRLGSLFEIDIGTFRDVEVPSSLASNGDGGLALATYAPPQPTLTLEPDLADQDEYEVRIYESREALRLVAAIEIVSPANKDRPDHRNSFVAKVAALVKNNVCVSIVDLVTTMDFNLYSDLLRVLDRVDPQLSNEPSPIYAVTLRTRHGQRRKLVDLWYQPLVVGQSLPTLPIWLNERLPISLDLEASYEECCRTLRIR
jgi:Protein of unknown function (DUF4058)